jgi:uncharacterized tellurite resistance protein B-like protein
MHLVAADIESADDSAKLAILECMLLAIFADGAVNDIEIRRFDAIVAGLPWGMDEAVLIALLKGAQERMKPLNHPQAILDFVANIATRVTSQTLREKIVYTMGVLAAADGTLHQFEKNMLGVVVTAFDVTRDKVEQIKAAVAETAPKR